MKTNLKTIGIATVLMLSTLLMGCGSKEALGKKELERKAKNYARADEIRDQLKALGYAIEDSRQGAKLKKL